MRRPKWAGQEADMRKLADRVAVSLLILAVFFALYPGQRTEAQTGSPMVPEASLPEPTEGIFGTACVELRRFRALDRAATPPTEHRAAATETATRLHAAFREPLAARTAAGLCREGSMVFRFDDGGAMVWHILDVLDRGDFEPEAFRPGEDVLHHELLEDFRARIAWERLGAVYHGRGCSAHPQWSGLMSTIHEAVTRWQFSIDELALTPAEREDLASRLGTPRPENPVPVEDCPV